MRLYIVCRQNFHVGSGKLQFIHVEIAVMTNTQTLGFFYIEEA